MSEVLDRLRGCLIVSCQPVKGGPLDRPDIIAAFALAALDGGARGLRVEGLDNIRAVRTVTNVPIIGLIKESLPDSPVRITPHADQARSIAEAGADIVAFDATDRVRPEPISNVVRAIIGADAIAMADCSNVGDGRLSAELGCEVLGSTMSGYLGEPVPEKPDLELVSGLAALRRFTIAEGRYQRPEDAVLAKRRGANAVVVGSAITRPEHVTSWFADALSRDPTVGGV